MTELLDTPCVILAGGESRRFGSPKAVADFDGVPLIHRILERIERQSSAPVAINANEPRLYTPFACPILEDDPNKSDIGPLAGISAAMRWGWKIGASKVATVSVDTPFLPSDLLVRFDQLGAPVVASSADQIHAVCGLWKPQQLEALEECIENGVRAARAWVEICGAHVCEFEVHRGRDPFFNVNTRDDLKLALDMLNS